MPVVPVSRLSSGLSPIKDNFKQSPLPQPSPVQKVRGDDNAVVLRRGHHPHPGGYGKPIKGGIEPLPQPAPVQQVTGTDVTPAPSPRLTNPDDFLGPPQQVPVQPEDGGGKGVTATAEPVVDPIKLAVAE